MALTRTTRTIRISMSNSFPLTTWPLRAAPCVLQNECYSKSGQVDLYLYSVYCKRQVSCGIKHRTCRISDEIRPLLQSR